MNERRNLRDKLLDLAGAYRGLLLLLPLLVAGGWLLAEHTSAFGRPEALVGLVCVSMLLLLLGYEASWRRAGRRRFASGDLLQKMGEPSLTPPLLLRGLLLTAALVLIMLAAARPKGALGETTLTGEGIDLAICLDVSNSMRVRDMAGRSRLDVSKELIGEYIEQRPGDRIALVAFAGSAHVMCPFTLDHNTLQVFLKDLDYHSVAEQGTALGTAIRTAAERFGADGEGGRAILLLTDGEDQDSDPLAAAAEAAGRGIVIQTIGIGTPQGGGIPMELDYYGNPIMKRHRGREVTSTLDEAMLKEIAAAAGGHYFHADSATRLREVLQEIAGLRTKVMQSGKLELREEIFWWYLLPAVLLLAAEPLLLPRRRRDGRET